MRTHNNITGDKIQSKVPSQDYKDNYDKIFRKTPKVIIAKGEDLETAAKIVKSRIDVIGQNGNDGEHYDDSGC